MVIQDVGDRLNVIDCGVNGIDSGGFIVRSSAG